jgi:hypothetical protein
VELVLPVETAPEATGLKIKAEGATTSGEAVEFGISLPLSSGGVLTCDEVLQPGTTAAVRLASTRRSGGVLLDLLIDGRFTGSAGGTLTDGRCEFALPIRDGLGGPARLVARRHDGAWIGSRRVRIGTRDLEVAVAAEPDSASPGEVVTVRAEVRGADGPMPALLDVRGFHRGYLDAVGGFRTPVPGFLAKAAEKSAYYELASIGRTEPLAALEMRGMRAVGKDLAKACLDDGVGGVAPWGSPVIRFTGRVGRWDPTGRVYGRDAILARTEPPVTARPGREGEYPLACPVDFSWSIRTAGLIAAEEIVPSRAPLPEPERNRRINVVDQGLDWWFERHQSSDGSWRPRDFTHRCTSPECEGRGHPYLHPGSTALAVLAFLGAGNTHRHGNHKKTGKAGLRYLKTVQGTDGFFGDPGTPWALLNHSMATLTMCEAYAMTGSPLFRQSAISAISRLLAEQRPDGSFGERSFREGSLVLTGWATMAMKSSKAAGLVAKQEAFEAVREWIRGREVRATAEERATYPFSLEDGSTGPAGITAFTLINTGVDSRNRTGELPEIPLPVHPETDLHASYWGGLAAFQIGGDVWKAYNEALKTRVIDFQRRRGCARGSWDTERGPIGRVAATAFAVMSMEVYYRYGRVFGTKRGGAAPLPRVRRTFLDAAIADLAVPTDDFGRAAIEVTLPDDLTTWDLFVGAWDGRGGYAVGRGGVRSALPIGIECEIPGYLVKGDRMTVPLRIRSRLATKAEVRIAVETSKNLEVVNLPRKLIDVEPGDAFAVPVAVRAKAAGPATFRVTAIGEEYTDAWERSLTIRSDRYPFALTVPVSLDEPTGAADLLPKDADRLTASLEIITGSTAEADATFRGLIRRPTGCFEQTAATLYPMMYALRYLERRGLSDPALSEAARRHLLTGYQRLLSFETEAAGFSLYGDGAPDPALTALGIHILLDLENHQAVDRGVLNRAARWLSGHLPRSGAARIYAQAALKRAGREVRFEMPGDPYLLALATVHDLLSEGGRAEARKTFEARPIRTMKNGLFTRNRASRTTLVALRALALKRTGGDPDLILTAADDLRSNRAADGGWGTTRETVLALRALLGVADLDSVEGRATLDGAKSFDLVAGVRRTIDLGAWSHDRQIHLAFEGTGRPRARLVIRGTSERPPRTVTGLALDVVWPKGRIPVGRAVTATITLTAKSRTHAPMVVVPIPGGFRTAGRIDAGRDFSLCLVREGRLELYMKSIGAGETARIEVPLIPDFRGWCTPAPAEAYPYYAPDEKALEPGPVIVVR